MYQLPENSRVMRELQPANNWGWPETLLNKIGYLLEVLAWQNSEDAANGNTGSAPELYTPPFMQGAINARNLDPDQELHTTDEIDDILSRPRL